MFAGIVAKAADGASRDAGLWADLKGQKHLCSDDFVKAMQARSPVSRRSPAQVFHDLQGTEKGVACDTRRRTRAVPQRVDRAPVVHVNHNTKER